MVRDEVAFLEQTLDAIEAIGVASSAEDVLAHVANTVSTFGFTALVLTRLPRPGSGGGPQILLDGWPEGWSDRYNEAGHFEHDPLAKHCLTSTATFSWKEIPGELMAHDRASTIVHEAAEFRLRQGLCVPMHTRMGMGGLSLAGDAVEDTPGLRRAVRLLAFQAGQTLESGRLASGEGPQLSVRERDVLSWIAVGKTVADVAAILAISEHTVGEHLKNIRRKLGTSNSAHSVVRALQLSQLTL